MVVGAGVISLVVELAQEFNESSEIKQSRAKNIRIAKEKKSLYTFLIKRAVTMVFKYHPLDS